VNKNLERLLFDFFLLPYKKAEVPARNTNIGAQKWVIHRVKNNIGVVVSRFVGSANIYPVFV
jgi:hypothetical protein